MIGDLNKLDELYPRRAVGTGLPMQPNQRAVGH